MTEIVKATPAASLPEKMQYAEAFANSGLLPAQYRRQPANLLYALEFAESLGLHPMAAITGIHVIEGKPSASAGLISALVRRAGHKLRVRGDDHQAVAQIVRADDPDFTFEVTWTLERAHKAGLTGKKVWKQYPAAMLKARAITEVAREACEEALSGVHYTPEELGAQVDADGEPVDAEVTRLRRVPAGEPDPWATPAPQMQTAAQGRDYLHEAHDAPDADTVRRIWQEAKVDGAVPEYLAQIANVGRAKATSAAEKEKGPAADEPVDAEVVPDPPADEHAAAVAELRQVAAELGIDDIDTDAHSALGAPIAEVAPGPIRDLAAQLRGTAA